MSSYTDQHKILLFHFIHQRGHEPLVASNLSKDGVVIKQKPKNVARVLFLKLIMFAGSILQIEPGILHHIIGFEHAPTMKNAKCFGSIEDD